MFVWKYICPQTQRALQLQIEKQGRYLQMMFEKQQKLEENNKSSSSSKQQCNGASAEAESGVVVTQALDQTESAASASRKRARED